MKYDDDDEEEERLIPRFKDNGESYFELLCKLSIFKRDLFVPYNSLSTSQKQMFIIDLLISKAREVSRQRLTLLLLDNLPSHLDIGNFEKLLQQLANEDFQVMLALPYKHERFLLKEDNGQKILIELDYLKGWKLAVLHDAPL